jgi:anaerobic selenocysteine-containing dehydrogenase
MNIRRRTFLKISALSSLSNFFLPNVFAKSRRGKKEEPYWIPKVGRYATTICDDCFSGCGIRVKRVEKNAVKVEGNPDFPMNNGALCPRGQTVLQSLYNPDRLKTPLQRNGARGSNDWREIDWDSAIDQVAKRLHNLRVNNRPHALALLSGRLGEGTPYLLDRFMKSYGSPNLVWCPSLANESVTKMHHVMEGKEEYKAYDLANTQYILAFGDVLLQNPNCCMPLLGSLKNMRFNQPGKRVKLLAVDSRLSNTAVKADEWVAIHPGTEGALALGMAHVMIRENLYDKTFIAKHTFGFEDWQEESGEKHTGFKNMVMQEYSPQQVSSITGVPSETVIRLATEFATHRPALALCSHNPYLYSNGVYNAMACHALNALAGSFNTPGGMLYQRKPPVTDFPLMQADNIAKHGLSMPRIDSAGDTPFRFATHAAANFSNAIINQNPYAVDTLMIYHANPLFNRVDSASFQKALEKIPFVVNFSPYMDETALYADLILPDSTFLERWESTSVSSSVGRAVFGVRQPVVEPLYNTRNTGDVIIGLAKKIGKPVSSAFPWEDSQHLVKERIRGIQELGKGSIVESYSKKFWKKLLDQGGWWEQDYAFENLDTHFTTPSGKFEFFSQFMQKTLAKRATTGNPFTQEDQKFMPHYEPPQFQGDKKNFPLMLIPFPTASLGSGGGANQPYLQEVFGGVHGLTWETWVEVSPQLANRLGITDHDLVWIESPKGRIKARPKIFPGASPDVVHIPMGQGHTSYGRYASGTGINPLSIVERVFDPISGAQVLAGTRIRIYKA